jgi:hypothetical protein
MKTYTDSEKAQQLRENVVTTADLRFYPHTDENDHLTYLPSVTTILDRAAPKDPFLIEWFKRMPAQEQDIHVRKAAQEGSNVHDALERYGLGHELNLYYTNLSTGEQYQTYSMKEWGMICKGVECLNMLRKINKTFKVILVEQKLASPTLGYAGTCDLVVKVGREHWLIDYKTSNSLSDTMHNQTIAYADLIKDQLNINIKRRFILWLKANTRTYNETKMNGKGWQLVEHTDDQLDREMWNMYLKIYQTKYGAIDKPHITVFPSVLSQDNPYFEVDYKNIL